MEVKEKAKVEEEVYRVYIPLSNLPWRHAYWFAETISMLLDEMNIAHHPRGLGQGGVKIEISDGRETVAVRAFPASERDKRRVEKLVEALRAIEEAFRI